MNIFHWNRGNLLQELHLPGIPYQMMLLLMNLTTRLIYRMSQKSLTSYDSFFHINKVSIKCHFFDDMGKTVYLNFNGLTSVNSLCSIPSQEMIKKGRFPCPYKLIERSLRVVDQSQNLYGTTIQMMPIFSLCFKSIALIVFELF